MAPQSLQYLDIVVTVTKYIKVEYRAGTKRKLTRSRLLVHTIYAMHNNSQPKYINNTSLYNIGLVSLIYLGWELLCVAYIVCTSNLDLVSFIYVLALYSTLKFKDLLVSSLFVLSNVIIEDIVGLYTCTRQVTSCDTVVSCIRLYPCTKYSMCQCSLF